MSADYFVAYYPEHLSLIEEDGEEVEIVVPERDDWLSYVTDNFLLVFGGGLDVIINETFSIRPFQADYFLTRDQGNFYPDLRFSAGVVYKIGER